MKLKYTKQRMRHILVCSGLKKEGINRKDLDSLYNPPEGLLRVLNFDESKQVITYDVGCCVPLSLYYKQKCFSADEVLMLVRQLLEILKQMENNRLTMQKLVLDFKYVFYNIDQRMLQLVFCPVQNNYTPLESDRIFTFLRELVSNAVVISDPNTKEDKIQNFLFFLKKQQQFSAQAIAVFFEENSEVDYRGEVTSQIELPHKSSYGPPTTSDSYDSGLQTSSVSPAASTFSDVSNLNCKPTTPVASPSPSTSIEDMLKGFAKNSTSGIAAPSDTIDAYDSGTDIDVPSDTLDACSVAVLVHNCSKVEYELPLSDCVIGRVGVDGNGKTVAPDLAVTDNRRVGKFHAKIIYDGVCYFIIDLNSKNKTRVNGVIIPPGLNPDGSYNGQKTLLENGAQVQLASEGYTFVIKEG